MKWDEQGFGRGVRYAVVPRTLCFLVEGKDVLLLRGAADKPLWAGRLNGVGGHIEPGEDPLTSARREVQEETGLVVRDLSLRAIVHIAAGDAERGVMLFVFVGRAPSRAAHAGSEGELGWYPISQLPWAELVDDLRELLPRVLGEGASLVYSCYRADAFGQMTFSFVDR
jgi:8-oxo-dGTP diphosphatase